MAAQAKSPTLTLAGVAALARVQRPVVSAWRTRSVRSGLPFPRARAQGRQEVFDAGEIAEWLTATGRGNNPHVREEQALFAVLGQASRPGQPVFDVLTALLAVKAATAKQLRGRSAAELLDLADDVDPHDRALYREIDVVGEDVTSLAAHVDAMASAAYTAAAAFEAVMRTRFRFGLREYSDTALEPAAVELATRIAVELIDEERTGDTTFVDPSGGSDLLVGLRAALTDSEPLTAALGAHQIPASRLARRRLIAHGWRVDDVVTDDDGRVTLPGLSVALAQYPSPASYPATDEDVLNALDDVALAMDDGDRAVVIGPASALVDAARSRAVESARSALLRTDRVRAIVRLPAGLWTARPRQQLALWVLGRSHPGVAIAERWTTTADLSAHILDGAVVEDLVTDVVAALGDRAGVRRHAFRFARLVPTASLLASSGDLVGSGRARVHRSRQAPAELALRVQELAARVVEPVAAAPLVLDIEHHEPGQVHVTTLGELTAAGTVRLIAGNRIDPADIGNDGDVQVIGAEEILGARALGERTVDRLDFSARYRAGRYTEPGDVVFCSTPGVGALVDTEGFSVVLSPARILRAASGARTGLLPDVLARDIRSATGRAGWRAWPVRLVPAAQASALGGVLGWVADERAAAARRLAALDELAATLTEGVAVTSLTLNPDPGEPTPAGREEGQ